MCAKYVDKINDNIILREDFLKFVPVHDVTGNGLSVTLLNSCKDLKHNLNYLKGQGYDGASAMSGIFQGCATLVSAQYPQAPYVHCSNHSLNLAIGDACSISTVRNCLGIIREIITFFRSSAQRPNLFE